MDEIKEENKVERNHTKVTNTTIKRTFVLFTAISLGYIHYKYVSKLFENDRNFSYLSDLEREMSLRTEMGFYYSYYKTVVQNQPFVAGVTKLMYDRLVEYPKEVNAFNRFNIHPEVFIASLYRYLEPVLNHSKECHMIDRGSDLEPVESCVGIGVPIIFYLEAVWILAGVLVAAIFLHATTLSQSALGGLLAVIQYFTNHNECTRVQWAPNERENMAVPLLILQMWLLTVQLRDKDKKNKFQLQVSIFLLNCICLLFWQFTQFIFLTQTFIFFFMEQLRIIDIKTLCVFLHSHFCGLHMAILLLQGNDFLKSSLYTSYFLVVSIYSLFLSSFRIKVQDKTDFFVEAWLVMLRLALSIFLSAYLKKLINGILESEDSHVWEILFSKFTNYKTFHTMIYTCSEVFGFLPLNSILNLTKTFLIPIFVFNIFNVGNYFVYNALSVVNKENKLSMPDKDEQDSDSGIENNEVKKVDLDVLCKKIDNVTRDEFVEFFNNLTIDPAVFYNFSQTIVFGVMAGLVMRLKLLFGTQLCVVSSMLLNANYYMLPKWSTKYLYLLWLVILMPIVRNLTYNTGEELKHIGEFSDIPQEQLLEWARSEEGNGGAFAGSMPVLSSIMLSARRPIVAHPHYEHREARQRAYAVYKTYGKFTPHDLYQEMTKLRATYLVVETKYCYGRSNKGCAFDDIWDVEYPELKGNPRVCHTLLTEPVEHFYPVFRNKQYAVFRIHDFGVRYMPRSFDT